MLNSANDPITGGLNITGGNVGIGVTTPLQPLVISGEDISSGDVGDGRKGTIHLVNLSGTQAQGTITSGISFGRAGSSRRKALIGSIQTGADNDQIGIGIYTNSTTSTSIDTVTQKFIITHDGLVGIGTSDPSSTLEISGAGISTTFQGETISAGTTERLRIGYRSGGPESGLTCGQIIEDTNTLHIAGRDTSNGDIIFHAGGSVPEVMRLEASSGNVGIGTDDPDYPLDIGGQHARIGDGTSVGIIQYGSNSNAVSNFHLGSASGVFRLWNGDIGAGTEILRISPSGGVSWDAGGNFLDDYEEGSFTPQFRATTTNPTYTAGSATGYYTKIGRMVNFTITLSLTSLTNTPSGTLTIAGLPFTSIGQNNARAAGAVGYSTAFDNTDGSPVGWLMGSNATQLTLYRRSGDLTYINDVTGLPATSLSNNSTVRFTGSYTAA